MRVSPTASTSSLPISGERHTSAITSATRGVPISNTAKRPRLSDDASHAIQTAAATVGANSNHISSPTFPYRIDIDLPPYSLSQLHSHHPSLTALYSGGNPMANLMNGSPSSFLPQSPFDLSRGNSAAAAALRSVTFPPTGPSQYSPHGQQQPPSLFSRPQSSPQGGGGGGGGPHSHGSSHAHASASSLFADLLGAAGEHGNGAGHPGAGAAQFPTFDWPVHASAASQQGAQGQHENGTWVRFRIATTAREPVLCAQWCDTVLLSAARCDGHFVLPFCVVRCLTVCSVSPFTLLSPVAPARYERRVERGRAGLSPFTLSCPARHFLPTRVSRLSPTLSRSCPLLFFVLFRRSACSLLTARCVSKPPAEPFTPTQQRRTRPRRTAATGSTSSPRPRPPPTARPSRRSQSQRPPLRASRCPRPCPR